MSFHAMPYPRNNASSTPSPLPAPTSSRASVAPRPVWRGLALLTAVIALAHLLVLGLVPAGMEHDMAIPLGGKFSTRTIVLAPPAAPAAPAPTPAAPSPMVSKLAQPVPKPHLKPKPKPSPTAPLAALDPEPATPPPLTTLPVPPDSTPNMPDAPDTVTAGTDAPGSATTDGSAAADVAPNLPERTASTSVETTATGPNANIGTDTRAMKIPGSTRLEFSVSGQQGTTPYQGGYGELVWLQNGTDYDVQLTLKVLFFTLLNQHSTGHVGSDGLAPDRFADKRRNRAELAAHFVRDSSRIVFSNNKPDAPLQPGAQDRLSVMMQLGALLAGDTKSYPPGSTITVQTVGTSDGDIWTFNVEADETLDLPDGTYQTRKLSRSPRREFDDKVELWLAPSLGYLPVRVRFTQAKGDFFDIQLRSGAELIDRLVTGRKTPS